MGALEPVAHDASGFVGVDDGRTHGVAGFRAQRENGDDRTSIQARAATKASGEKIALADCSRRAKIRTALNVRKDAFQTACGGVEHPAGHVSEESTPSEVVWMFTVRHRPEF